jgi:hypothetical protein
MRASLAGSLGVLRRARLALVSAGACLALGFVIPSSAAALFTDSGRLNVDPADSASQYGASIASVGGVPYVAWTETTPSGARSYLFSDRFSGGRWSGVGGLIDQSANFPALGDVGGVPYLAFSDNRSFLVDQLVNGVWTQVGNPIYNFCCGLFARMASGSTGPWVVWNLGPAFAADFSGGAWHPFLVANGARPSITIPPDGVPWVAFNINGITRVVRLGVTVQDLGSPDINPSRAAGPPSITTIGGVPYVAWSEDVQPGGWREIRVARWNGSGWSQVGASANVDPTARADNVSITGVNGAPWVAFQEPSGGSTFVHVREFAGGFWEPAGDAPEANAQVPQITTAGDSPFVAFIVNKSPQPNEIHVLVSQRLTPLVLAGVKTLRTKQGTTFVVPLKRPAIVRIDIARSTFGRVVNGKCVALTRRNRGKPRCTRNAVLGTLRFKGRAGVNKFKFNGRLPGNKSLKAGRYLTKITASSSGGSPSVPVWLMPKLP